MQIEMEALAWILVSNAEFQHASPGELFKFKSKEAGERVVWGCGSRAG